MFESLIEGLATYPSLFVPSFELDELLCIPYESQLRKVLESHGWKTHSFEGEVDFHLLRKDLGNSYLAQGAADTHIATPDSIVHMFCPDILLHVIGERSSMRTLDDLQPFSRAFKGTCMLADISGFTNLASSLCRMSSESITHIHPRSSFLLNNSITRDMVYHTKNNGSQGLDELRSTTNIFLGNLVQTVYSFGGDVIEFAGDALLCVFSDEFGQSPEGKHSSRAFRCAEELILLSTMITEKPLRLHVALSSGELYLAVIGGFQDKWTYVLNGEPLQELSSCIDEAKMNEIAVTDSVFNDIHATMGSCSGFEFDCTPTKCGNHVAKLPYGIPPPTSGSPRAKPVVARKSAPALTIAGLFTRTYSSPAMPSRDRSPRSDDACKEWAEGSLELFSPPSISETDNALTLDQIEANRYIRNPIDGHKDAGIFSRDIASLGVNTELLKAFVPPPVTAAMLSGAIDLCELRQVTTMFLKLDSFNATVHKDPVSLQSFFNVVQTSLSETGGFLRQFLVDDKGLICLD